MGSNSLTLDPRFVDRAGGDYHLTDKSPLIDKGETLPKLGEDFDGDPRPHQGGIDIGADEFYTGEIFVSQIAGNDTTGDGSQSTPFATVTKALHEVQTTGTVHVARGIYTGAYSIERSVNLLGGFMETTWERSIPEYTTTLDGLQNGPVIQIYGEGIHATVEGFEE